MAVVRIASCSIAWLLALLAAGCGGPRPVDVVRAHFVAIVDRDGERACDQLTPALRADIERAPAARDAGRGCADIMQLAAALNPSLRREQVESLEIRVQEDGERAQATLRNPFAARRETLQLERDGGAWKISTLVTRPRP